MAAAPARQEQEGSRKGAGWELGGRGRGLSNDVLLAAVIKKYCIVIILFLCATSLLFA